MSARLQRASAAITGPLMCVETVRTASASASEAIGKTGFDEVHAQRRQLAGHLQLLVDPHREAGRLFAVAQRGVENDEPVSHSVLRDIPFVTRCAALRPIYNFWNFYKEWL